jgi:hypothetical protein
MVDVERKFDERTAILTTNKKKAKYRVVPEKTKGALFVFEVDNGSVPKELQGKFTTIEKAIEVFKDFDRLTKQTFPAKRKEIEEERNAKLSAENG